MNKVIKSFAAGALKHHLDILCKHMKGVFKNQDIEPVHQSRVSSRKIRTVLTLFPKAFPDKKAKKWLKEIKNITRKLGKARDLDVQITFLENSPGPAKDTLMNILIPKRKECQPDIEKALLKFNQSGVIRSICKWCRKNTGTSKAYTAELYSHAAFQTGKALDRFLRETACFNNPNEIKAQHKARIKLKHLRYTLEIFNPLYNGELDPFFKTAKSLQTCLGSMHDCDVWINISGKLEETSKAIQEFRKLKQKERFERYADLVALWTETVQNQTWEQLISLLESYS